ncbi:protein-tyrosine phosphatase family protein [Phenylobacterium sp.]|uniref:protein-tyrosine phosphatase family protein n=1 Tax=Phenylobacterium sp. TaxID=1871053 RepID=UPI002C77CA13|nr:dual specificity protein phosphatase family protein [Phenylobacterium sp.]HVI30632.1 dual specificity protein phosphatase family protein [Phenylobacterium sp.]
MDGAWTPNLSWVAAGLAVGGSFPAGRAGDLARAHGVGAVIDVRSEACDDPDELAACGLRFLHLPTPDHHAVAQPMLDLGVDFAGQAKADGLSVLVHCEHGIGRSALVALCVLVDRGLGPLEALARAKDARALVSPSPAQYDAWVAWLGRRSPDARIPTFDAFKAIAYRHLHVRS